MIHRLGISAASNSHCWTVSLSMKVRSDLNFAAQVRPVDCVPFWKMWTLLQAPRCGWGQNADWELLEPTATWLICRWCIYSVQMCTPGAEGWCQGLRCPRLRELCVDAWPSLEERRWPLSRIWQGQRCLVVQVVPPCQCPAGFRRADAGVALPATADFVAPAGQGTFWQIDAMQCCRFWYSQAARLSDDSVSYTAGLEKLTSLSLAFAAGRISIQVQHPERISAFWKLLQSLIDLNLRITNYRKRRSKISVS